MATMLAGTQQMSPEQIVLREDALDITTRLHLEIEAFYLFAKILLDKVAQAIQFYFGPARGISLSSHDKLLKYLASYAEAKGLTIDESFISKVEKLKATVSDFRDYQISHIEEGRRGRVMRGTMFTSAGSSRMSIGMLYPQERDRQFETQPLNELLAEFSDYIDSVVDFIKPNQERTHLMLIEQQQDSPPTPQIQPID